MAQDKPGLYSRIPVFSALVISLLYLAVSYFLIGFKTDQLVLTLLFNACFFLSATSRKFIIGFSIFIVYWILFDYMKAFPNYAFNEVHIADLYQLEKSMFGIQFNNQLVTPNEFWRLYGNTFLDVLSGLFYLCWIPVPLAFAAYLFFTDKKQFLYFSLTFVLVNMIGFVVYYIYPAAPPWYYQLHGAEFIPSTPGNTAGLLKFDAYFDTPVFYNLYSKSSNVFAAMPSLHSSYPLIVVYYGLRKKMGWVNGLFIAVAIGIWFAAIYSSHHYVLDVLAGIVCAIAGIGIFNSIVLRNRLASRFLNYYEANI